MGQTVLAGGNVEKRDSANYNSGSMHSKQLLGDNFGQVHLLDVSRKQILDKLEISKFKGRRILNISTASLEWIDSKLTYASIVARGSPFIEIVCFKQNENKIFKLYSINTCPELENPESLEQN